MFASPSPAPLHPCVKKNPPTPTTMEPPQRVQTLAEAGLHHLPPEYIQPPDARPPAAPHHPPDPVDGLPVVDLFGFDPGRRDRVRGEIQRACREWGAFQVVNHGVAGELLCGVIAAGRRFFGLPRDERQRYSCDPRAPASEGYGSRMLSKDDGVLDWRDYFDHHTLPLSRRDPARWPDLGNYRELLVEYSDNMKMLAQKLLCMISESLGLPPLYIEEVIGKVYQNITISYYPPCPQPELALGLQSHSDMGAITLLIQDDVGGLEVLKDGLWNPVVPLPNAIVVILADQTEIISNGEFRSAVHRAIVNRDWPRLSVATFYDPSKITKISPAPELVTESSPVQYHEVLYGDYISSWYGKGPDGKRNIDALLVHH